MTRDQIELRKERLDLRSVVNDAIETSRPLFEKNGHALSVQLPDEPVILEADPTRITQVLLLNLISNAIKYTERGGHIWITTGRDSKNVTIRVKDTGIDMLTRIFDMFTRLDDSPGRSQDGLGIGLTLVQRLVNLHGGVVEAHSNGPGTGSEFIVRLPAIAPANVTERES